MFGKHRAAIVRPYRPMVQVLEARNLLSTYVVDHLADDLVGTGLNGSLRYCISNAMDDDAITFGVTGTINLTSALPDLTHNISINGPGANLLTVRRDTGGDYPIFWVGATVAISGLTIAYGNHALADYPGGGIYNGRGGSLTVSNCTVSGNVTGIFNEGSLTVSNCTVTDNLAGDGAGILNFGGTATVNNSTIARNTVAGGGEGSLWAGYGGGVANEAGGAMTIANSTISGNTAYGTFGGVARGGGIFNGYTGFVSGGGDLVVTNSTITGNVAGYDDGYHQGYGGGIASDSAVGEPPSTVTINNCTISANSALSLGGGSLGGGIAYRLTTLNMRNSIVAGNSADSRPDLSGTLTSSGYNLIGNTQGGSGFDATDLLNVNPLLGPLQDNGGPTQTMALLAGSPALNAGAPDQLGVPDQRGVVRTGGVNIGAYQASATVFILTAPDRVTAGVPFDVTVTAVDVFGQVALGYSGTVTFSTSDTDPNVVLPADYTFTASDQGTHPFTGGFTLMTPGNQTITASDTVDNTIVGTATVTVISGGAAPDRLYGTDRVDALFTVLVAEGSPRGQPNGSLTFWDGWTRTN